MRATTGKSSFKEVTEAPQGRRLLEQELLLVSAAELISKLLDEKRLSRAELARRIGKSKAFVTQVLRGRHNMTLRTLADLAWALEARVEMSPVNWDARDARVQVSPGNYALMPARVISPYTLYYQWEPQSVGMVLGTPALRPEQGGVIPIGLEAA